MTIDFHTHTFPDAIAGKAVRKLAGNSHTMPFLDGTANALRGSMRRAGIDRCVVLPVATAARQVPHINDAALETDRHAEETGVYSLGGMHPDYESFAEELRRLKDGGIRGIKLHPPYQGVDFDDARTLRILSACAELGLFVVIHAGWDVGLPGEAQALPEKIYRAVRAVGPVRLVCAHMGGWRCWDEVETLLSDTPVLIDTAFSLGSMTPLDDGTAWRDEDLRMMAEEQFIRLVRRFGAERVLFGTDSPWADQKTALADFLALPLSEQEKTQILGGNAASLMGWTERGSAPQ